MSELAPPPRCVLASDDSALSERHLCTLKLHLHEGGGEVEGGGALQGRAITDASPAPDLSKYKHGGKKRKPADQMFGTEKSPETF